MQNKNFLIKAILATISLLFFGAILVVGGGYGDGLGKFMNASLLDADTEVTAEKITQAGEYRISDLMAFYLDEAASLEVTEIEDDEVMQIPTKVSAAIESGKVTSVNLLRGGEIDLSAGDFVVKNLGGTTTVENEDSDSVEIVVSDGFAVVEISSGQDDVFSGWLLGGEKISLTDDFEEKLLGSDAFERAKIWQSEIQTTTIRSEKGFDIIAEIFEKIDEAPSLTESWWLQLRDWLTFAPAARERLEKVKTAAAVAKLTAGEEVDFDKPEELLPYARIFSAGDLPTSLTSKIGRLAEAEEMLASQAAAAPLINDPIFEIKEKFSEVSDSDGEVTEKDLENYFALSQIREDQAASLIDQILIADALIQRKEIALAAQSLQQFAEMLQSADGELSAQFLQLAKTYGEDLKNRIIFVTMLGDKEFDEKTYQKWLANQQPASDENAAARQTSVTDWSSKILRLRPQWFELFATK